MGVAMSHNGHRLYVTTGVAGSVAVLDPAAGEMVRMIRGDGTRPRGVAVASDGKLAPRTALRTMIVLFINPASGQVLARLAVGRMPWGVTIDP